MAAYRMIFGECEPCGKPGRVLHHGEVSGLETYYCAECGGGKLSDDLDDLQDEIERIIEAKPTTAKEWLRVRDMAAAVASIIGKPS